MKVWKTGAIHIVSGVNENLLIEVPLKIWVKKGIGTLGMYTYQETTFELVMYFNTAVRFNTNWTITTDTKANGFKWVSKPYLDYGQVKMPITSIVESSLKEEQQKFSKTIDDQLKKQLNFQEDVRTGWNFFSQPFLLSEEYKTWLKITPQQIDFSKPKFYRNAIDLMVGMNVFSETFIGLQPQPSPPIQKVPDFKNATVLPNNFVLQTTANITYAEATNLAKNMFLDKVFDFKNGKYKVMVSGISVYGTDDRLTLEIETKGALEGVSIITGTPVYDEIKRKIVLRNSTYKLKTPNLLYKAVSLIFQKKITKMIEEEYGIPLAEIEDTSKKSTEETFNKEYYKGMRLSGKVIFMKPGVILLGDRGITVLINMQANLSLLIKGI